MAEYTKKEIAKLLERWAGKSVVIDEMISILKGYGPTDNTEESKIRLKEADELLKAEIEGYEEKTNGSDYEKVVSLDLRGIYLSRKDCCGAVLIWARLEVAVLFNAHLEGVNLYMAHLEGADLIGVHLEGARLSETHLNGADLWKAHLEGADLSESTLISANLKSANFRNAILSNVRWHDGYKKLWGFIPTFRLNDPPKSVKGTVIAGAAFANSRHFERYIKDEQFIQELKEKAEKNKLLKFFVNLWKDSCDYGRSMFKWTLYSLLLVIIWGLIYKIAGMIDANAFHFNQENDNWNSIITPFYYSIVTFTTLGFGDITPGIGKWLLQIFVTGEVIFGYVMLGGLISIFANKLARRAG